MGDFSKNFSEISELLQKGKSKDIGAAVEKALKDGAGAADILQKGLLAGMDVIGTKFKDGDVFIPEVLLAAKAMKQGAAVLKPALTKAGVKAIGKAVCCTVKGDQHDIGKNLVKMMIEGRGFEVTDLGADVEPDAIVTCVKQTGAHLVCLSALLTTTMMAQKDTIEALKAAGVRGQVKVLVGGSPITQDFCNDIGADGYAGDAASAADLAVSFFK